MTDNQSHARSWQINVIIALLIALLGFVAFGALKNIQANAEQQQQLIKWEYRVRTLTDVQLQEAINKLGEEGWEIVSMSRANILVNPPAPGYEIIFRRPANAPAPRY